MGTTSVRRGVLAAAAVSLCLLATACDSGGSAAAGGGSGEVRTEAAPGGTAKSAAALTRMLVAPADLPEYTVEEKFRKTGPEQKAETDKAACEPLVRAQAHMPLGKVGGTAGVAVFGKPEPAPADASEDEKLDALRQSAGRKGTSVFLDSYAGKGAEEAFAAVKGAVTACAGGYTAFGGPKAVRVEQVLPVPQDPAGDESLAFRLVLGMRDGQKTNMQFVYVRKGDVLATFEVLSLLGDAPQPPKAVVEAQSKKLV
ncbi:hypothetical protein ACFWJT_21585 [Streptomyces sp. NPDC127069]|uniref:hypothetical protein n=1 Tax=Streptomyces sp. NPDC127069 TaxID=3347128 RepID=UPI0036480ACB